MLYVISEIIETRILNEMREGPHFALMLDETTDCTVTEQLAIHGRYISSVTGELKSHFLKVIDVLQPEVHAVTAESPANHEACISVCAQ